jgi:hypothetical protein
MLGHVQTFAITSQLSVKAMPEGFEAIGGGLAWANFQADRLPWQKTPNTERQIIRRKRDKRNNGPEEEQEASVRVRIRVDHCRHRRSTRAAPAAEGSSRRGEFEPADVLGPGSVH